MTTHRHSHTTLLGFVAAACLGAVGCEGNSGSTDADTEDTSDASSDGTGTEGASTDGTETGESTGPTTGESTGPTTGDEPPALELTRITDPSWEIVDYHQGLVEIGGEWELWADRLAESLPPPNHVAHPDLGIGPGAAHAGPYDHEFADSWAAMGWDESGVYVRDEAFKPHAIMSAFMVTASADAPVGKTPDSESGPMIPHSLFPIHTQFDLLVDGKMVLGGTSSFDVLALDKIDPPFDVEGHSHFPIFSGRNLNGETVTDGPYETLVTMTDTTGSGWKIKFGFIARD